MTDQQGANAVGCYGAPGVRTERIDQLAAEGTRFERAYTASPVCTPARAGLHTGTYPHTSGAWTNAMALESNAKTFAKRLADHGYRCAHIGKWHLDGHDYFGTGEAPEPFERSYWYDGKNHLDTLPRAMRPVWRKGLKSVEDLKKYKIGEEFTWGYGVAKRACEFIEDAGSGPDPFLLVASFDEPHGPSTCPLEDLEAFAGFAHNPGPAGADTLEGKPSHQREWAATRSQNSPVTEFRKPFYFACNHFVDRLIGRIIDAVDERCAENTWVVYTSDHGDFLGAHWLGAKGPAMYDEITRVPLVIRPPKANRKQQVISEAVSLVDLAPTFLSLAGIETPPILDGRDLLPAIDQGGARDRGDVLIEFNRFEVGHDGRGGLMPIRCLVRGHYKFVINLLSEDELYDRAHDPAECQNLINNPAYQSVRNELHMALLELMDHQRDPFRGPCWERRPWSQTKERGWNGVERQRPDDGYLPPVLAYPTGLPPDSLTTQPG